MSTVLVVSDVAESEGELVHPEVVVNQEALSLLLQSLSMVATGEMVMSYLALLRQAVAPRLGGGYYLPWALEGALCFCDQQGIPRKHLQWLHQCGLVEIYRDPQKKVVVCTDTGYGLPVRRVRTGNWQA